MNTKTILSAAALAAAFVTGAAQAAPASNASGQVYGYSYRVNDQRSAFTDGARVNDQRSPFSDGARVGKADPFTDGARTVAGLDTKGVSASPARSADPYLDGARQGQFDVFTEGAKA
ncbi:copper resistance protein CopQ [Cupriavidus campinensis]